MQYILDANRAAQEKLKGSNPKELYIPFNAGVPGDDSTGYLKIRVYN